MTYTLRRNVMVFAALLCISACATRPEPRIVTKTVEVPVAVSCAVKVDRPDLPDIPAAIKSAKDIDELARAYRAYFLLANPYIAQLQGALKGCS